MADVYKVFDAELGEMVAMKLFTVRNDPGLIARFKQEVSLSRKLAHPNVVRLYDIGDHEGFKFLTMELLDGSDLAAMINGRPMDIRRGLNYLVQACMGLAVAHEAGVVHRDIKPDNFFVTKKNDQLKVMDFGIAKGHESAQKLTVAGFVAGTPSYMSPEQINNFAAVDHRTDLYALGVVAFEMFTGHCPFDAPDTMPLLMKHLNEAPPSPRASNPAIPPQLEAVVMRLLEKDPNNRIQTCRDLEAYLRAI
jgi:serine/threonine-protein kinase